MKPPYRVQQAFLQLEFSIKLFRYFEKGLVDKDAFDCVTDIPTTHGRVRLAADAFHTPVDLVLAAQNVYSSTLGVCAIAMDSALSDHSIDRNPSDRSPQGQLRTFVYQLRNAFAHDAMTPSWHVKGQHRQILDLRKFGLPALVDLRELDGQAVELDQFGGFPALEAVRDSVTRWVSTGSPLPPKA